MVFCCIACGLKWGQKSVFKTAYTSLTWSDWKVAQSFKVLLNRVQRWQYRDDYFTLAGYFLPKYRNVYRDAS